MVSEERTKVARGCLARHVLDARNIDIVWNWSHSGPLPTLTLFVAVVLI